MREILKKVREDKKYTDVEILEILKGLDRGVDISLYTNKGYNSYQMREIRKGLEGGIDVSWYTNKEFLAPQMEQIRIGLELGLDVNVYAKMDYNACQMELIIEGMCMGLDVSHYTNPKFSEYQMEQIKFGLESDLDVSQFAKIEYTYEKMVALQHFLLVEQAKVSPNEYNECYLDGKYDDYYRRVLERETDILSEEDREKYREEYMVEHYKMLEDKGVPTEYIEEKKKDKRYRYSRDTIKKEYFSLKKDEENKEGILKEIEELIVRLEEKGIRQEI